MADPRAWAHLRNSVARSQVHLALPDDLLAQVKEVAARDGRTVTIYLTGLIQEDLARRSNGSEDRLAAIEAQLQALEARVKALEP